MRCNVKAIPVEDYNRLICTTRERKHQESYGAECVFNKNFFREYRRLLYLLAPFFKLVFFH